MILMERITLEANPFPSPLPRPARELVRLFAQAGIQLEDRGRTLVFDDTYKPGRLKQVKRILQAESLPLSIRHARWPEFDDMDYGNAPLWILFFPEIWIDTIDFASMCVECGTRRVLVNTHTTVPHVTTKKAIVTINGQFTILRADCADEASRLLDGIKLAPFDTDGKYYYLQSQNRLANVLVREDEVEGYQGNCVRCSSPLFDKYFGPYRYTKQDWNGSDVVYCSFKDGNVYTPRAYDLFRKYEKRITKGGIVLLE